MNIPFKLRARVYTSDSPWEFIMLTGPHVHIQCVMLSHAYLQYESMSEPTWSDVAGQKINPSKYVRTVDYSQVVDACLEDLPEGKYL